jgi:hypothetical protein
MMRLTLRKAYEHIHVTYRDEDHSNNLTASHFAIEADEDRIVFSMMFKS